MLGMRRQRVGNRGEVRQRRRGHDRRDPARAARARAARAAAKFFGEPALDIARPDAHRRPTAAASVNVLAADQLMQSPQLYATFLLWLL